MISKGPTIRITAMVDGYKERNQRKKVFYQIDFKPEKILKLLKIPLKLKNSEPS